MIDLIPHIRAQSAAWFLISMVAIIAFVIYKDIQKEAKHDGSRNR